MLCTYCRKRAVARCSTCKASVCKAHQFHETHVRHRGWVRDIEVDGEPVTYSVHAASDPETVALMDELVRAAAKHMRQQREE